MEWYLRKRNGGDLFIPQPDLEGCLDTAIKEFGCTDDQIRVLRCGGGVILPDGSALECEQVD